MPNTITKAVIPAAGFGTRMLPATKSMPKEMMPVVGKPVIQYVVEEAVAAGITDILMIIGKGKRAIEEHFDRNVELELQLEEKGKTELLEDIRHISGLANIHFIWQKELNGLGDAISYARYHTGNEPFAVLLGDTILNHHGDTSVMAQMKALYEEFHAPVVALEDVPRELVSRYGIIDGEQLRENVYRARTFIEKPSAEQAPSTLAISGRYIFTPHIYHCLDSIEPGVNNEIQLTDAMRLALDTEAFYGLVYQGTRFDVGNTLDFIKTNIALALQRPGMAEPLRRWLKEL